MSFGILVPALIYVKILEWEPGKGGQLKAEGRSRGRWREQLQTCLLFHTRELSQQGVGCDLHGLQSGGCFTSTLHVSQEFLSHASLTWKPERKSVVQSSHLEHWKPPHTSIEIRRKNKYYLKCNKCSCCQDNPGTFFLCLAQGPILPNLSLFLLFPGGIKTKVNL